MGCVCVCVCVCVPQDVLRQGLNRQRLHVLAGTWNVNTSKAAVTSVHEWLAAGAKRADIVCIGLQVRIQH